MKLPPGHVPGVGIVKLGAYGGFGQKMLEKMGWSMGEGLGKQRDGLKEPIKPRVKTDTYGLGAKKESEWDVSHWEQIYKKGLEGLEPVSDDSNKSKTVDRRQRRRMSSRENPDGTASSAGKEELRIYERLSRKTRLGRWSSRNGKLKRIKKQEQQLRTHSFHKSNRPNLQHKTKPLSKADAENSASKLTEPYQQPSLKGSKKRKACE